MKINTKKYYTSLLIAFTVFIASCSVGNKVIPDPTGNIPVDPTATLGSFNLFVTGDTNYTATLLSDTSDAIGNFIVNDSLQVIATDGTNTLLFSTFDKVPEIYYTETAPPEITTALFIFQTKFAGVTRRFFMTHGNITITENDEENGVVKGSFDVNNEYTASDKILFLRANFILRYKVK